MSELIYKLVFSFSTIDQEEKRVEVTDTVTLGSTDKTDITIERAGLSTSHGRFSIQNDVLTYTHLTSSGVTLIGSQQCSEKKMYILDKSDVLKLGELNCYILREVPDPPAFSMQEEDSDLDLGLVLEEPPTIAPPPEEKKPEPQIIDEDPDGQTLVGLEIIQAGEYTANQELIAAEQKRGKKKKNLEKKLLPGLKKSSSPKKNSIEYIKKNKYKKRNFSYGTGIIARIVGDIYNILFFIIMFFYTPIFKSDMLSGLATTASQFLMTKKHLVTFIPPEVLNTLTNTSFLSFVFSLFIWNIVCSLVLGLNLGQWVIGLYAEGDILNTRLLGPIRVIISAITTPLLIFDAPILFSRRSFKELITGCQTMTRNTALTFLFSAAIIPCLYLFIATHNLFTNPANMALLLNSSKSDVISMDSKDKTKDSSNLIIQSEPLGLELNLETKENFEFITEITEEDQHSHLKFHFFDYKNSESISFYHQQILLRDEVKNIMLKDPLLMFNSPSLYENLRQSEKKSLDTVIIKKIYDILTIDKSKLLPYLINEGPYIVPILDLKELVTKKIGISDFHNINLIKNGLRYFLSFKLKDKDNEQHMLMANDKGLSLYTFTSPSESIDNDNVKRVMTEVFANARTLSEKPKVISTAEVFYQLSVNKTLTSEESQFLVKDFMNLARTAMNSNKRPLTDLVLKVFKGNEKGLIAVNKTKNDKNISELRLALNRIQKALYKRELEFFKLNP